MTQNEQIKDWLLSGRTLTPIEALNEFGCFRLSARIHNLRSKGLTIRSRTKVTASKKHVAEYFIQKEDE